MLKWSSFHSNSRAETFAPLINCVIDDAFLKTIKRCFSLYRHHELAIPGVAFIPYFCSELGSNLCFCLATGLV